MKPNSQQILERSPHEREAFWKSLVQALEKYRGSVASLPVRQRRTTEQVRAHLDSLPLGPQHELQEVLKFVTEGMQEFNLHSAHPRYFGVFNPHPSFLGIVAETLVSAYNPQLASQASASWPIAAEKKMIQWLGQQLDWSAEKFEGHLCNGGTESNVTALMTCLHSRFPNFADEGVVGLKARPILYVSAEAHHSFYRAAQACGLGRQSVREVKVCADLKLDLAHLRTCVLEDRARGFVPLMVVGSLGTTNAGVVDRLEEIASLAQKEGLWLHVDAAWGGAALLVPELKNVFRGVEHAQSVTLDLHKWFSVPFSAGVFLCRELGSCEKAFGLPRSPYMTKEKEGGGEPFETSLQWTRRFLGLKFFMTLLGTGTEAYAEVLRSQVQLGNQLKDLLLASGWKVWNETPLPVVCFTHPTFDQKGEKLFHILRTLQDGGDFWITSTQIGAGHTPVLRAGIPSFSTTEGDIRALVKRLDELLGEG